MPCLVMDGMTGSESTPYLKTADHGGWRYKGNRRQTSVAATELGRTEVWSRQHIGPQVLSRPREGGTQVLQPQTLGEDANKSSYDRLMRNITVTESRKDPESSTRAHRDCGPFSEAKGDSEVLYTIRIHLGQKYEKEVQF